MMPEIRDISCSLVTSSALRAALPMETSNSVMRDVFMLEMTLSMRLTNFFSTVNAKSL